LSDQNPAPASSPRGKSLRSASAGTGGGGRSTRRTGRVQFVCSECGDSFAQWFGRCPSCQAWGTLKEYRAPAAAEAAGGGARSYGRSDAVAGRAPEKAVVRRLREIPGERTERSQTGIGEFDRALGGGLVPGSVVLLGGDPGIGKSTLLLQVAGALAGHGAAVLYVSGEESAAQVRLRADRLSGVSHELQFLAETNLDDVTEQALALRPDVLIVDSIQTSWIPSVAAAPGSLSQVRESALALLQLAKSAGITVLMIGHVTKDGTLAGPRTLEHMVDTVLYLEGERYQHYRILRSTKNRFGSVHEIGVFEMAGDGLREVTNPSRIFLSEGTAGAVGSVVVASLEGSRAILMEVQSLVQKTRFGLPQRVSTGYDQRRLELLLAVLSKRGGVHVAEHNVFVNVAGGLKVEEPGVDLGILLAVASSRRNGAPRSDQVVVGEVGLGGEIRRVAHPEHRVAEASRLGYARVLLPEANVRDLAGTSRSAGAGPRREGVEMIGVSTVAEALYHGLRQESADAGELSSD